MRLALGVPAMVVMLALAGGTVGAQPHPAPKRTQIAPGIHLFQTAPYSDVGLDGNSIAIISDSGILVFDANGTPAAASAVLAELRKLSKQPVRWLVQSHWHWDHWYGAEVYKDANPELEIIAHERTRELMDGPAVLFNQPGLDAQLPVHIAQVEAQRDRAAANGDTTLALRGDAHLTRDRFFLDQKRRVRHTLATRTFRDSVVLQLGARRVVVRHHDRAITPGDAYLEIPAERIILLGDLLINPVTFALFSYPSGWISTLEAIDASNARLLVPGHAEPMRDELLLHRTLALLKRERVLAAEAKIAGLPVSEAIPRILADKEVRELRALITAGDAAADRSFPLYMVEWFVTRVYQELEGTLDDRIPSNP